MQSLVRSTLEHLSSNAILIPNATDRRTGSCSPAAPRRWRAASRIWNRMSSGSYFQLLVATGATLGVHHLQANTAAQALRPVAGSLAGGLFAWGCSPPESWPCRF
jgi:hypothetical protein